jgi:hypothetical protein
MKKRIALLAASLFIAAAARAQEANDPSKDFDQRGEQAVQETIQSVKKQAATASEQQCFANLKMLSQLPYNIEAAADIIELSQSSCSEMGAQSLGKVLAALAVVPGEVVYPSGVKAGAVSCNLENLVIGYVRLPWSRYSADDMGALILPPLCERARTVAGKKWIAAQLASSSVAPRKDGNWKGREEGEYIDCR